MKRQILFAPTPDPATLRELNEFTIEIHEDGTITGDLCKNTMDLLAHLEKEGIHHKPLIDFCG
jgi:hypothetical protein